MYRYKFSTAVLVECSRQENELRKQESRLTNCFFEENCKKNMYPVPGFSWLLDVIVCAVPRLILVVNNKREYS
jgi:hypothetical protein